MIWSRASSLAETVFTVETTDVKPLNTLNELPHGTLHFIGIDVLHASSGFDSEKEAVLLVAGVWKEAKKRC